MRKSVRRGVGAIGIAAGCGIWLASFLRSGKAHGRGRQSHPGPVTERGAPLAIADIGSLFFGGSVTRNALGDTFHGDAGYAQYLIPQGARRYPLVMWHGLGQSGKTWETTADGREGFQQIFARRGWAVYIIDQPRRGRAGNTLAVSTEPTDIPNLISEAANWETYRFGPWTPPAAPAFFPGVQIPRDMKTLDQFLYQQTPNTGAEPFPSLEQRDFLGGTIVRLFERTGPAVLITHSHSGQYGWVTAMKTPELVKAVIAIEPGEFAFPDDDLPDAIATPSKLLEGFMAPQPVAPAAFRTLTRMPILIVYGDNISDTPSTVFGRELWRLARARARQFVDTVNRHGGDARLLLLPEAGLHGNTHFPMSDLNNVAVADELSLFLRGKALDGRAGEAAAG